MKWQAFQSSDFRLPDGLKIPAGTIWSIDSDTEYTSSVLAKCQTCKIQTNFSYSQYVEIFGEDNHIWKVSQKVNGSNTNSPELLNTNIGDDWVVVDLGRKVMASLMRRWQNDKNRKTVKITPKEPVSFSYLQYIEVFGEDQHITKKLSIEKRFGL